MVALLMRWHRSTIKLWEVASGECVKIIQNPKLCEGMNITGVSGITEGQKANLKALDARIENI
jgi:hypothetical protein